MGAAFGSGSSGSLFGAAGSANFLSRTTAILAAVFFASSLGLTWFGTTHGAPAGVMQKGIIEKMAPKVSDVPTAPGALPAPAPERRLLRMPPRRPRRRRPRDRSPAKYPNSATKGNEDWQRSVSGRKWRLATFPPTAKTKKRNEPTW